MTDFTYNNTKNARIGHISFELHYRFHFQVLFEKDVNPYFRSHSINKLAKELKKLIKICYQNLFHV